MPHIGHQSAIGGGIRNLCIKNMAPMFPIMRMVKGCNHKYQWYPDFDACSTKAPYVRGIQRHLCKQTRAKRCMVCRQLPYIVSVSVFKYFREHVGKPWIANQADCDLWKLRSQVTMMVLYWSSLACLYFPGNWNQLWCGMRPFVMVWRHSNYSWKLT